VVVCLWLCCEAVAALGQVPVIAASSAPMTAEASDVVIKKRVDEVNLLFTVVDGKGRFINKLQLEDFNLLDDQRPPEKIRAFQQETDLPLRVGLLIDVSGSISGRFKFEQQAASNFLKKILRPATDQAFVAGFDTQVHLEQDFTGDVSALTAAVRRLKPHGETALFDALVFAANKLHRNAQPGTRRMLILISDGENNNGHNFMHEAEEAALRAEAPVYALSTNRLTSGDYTKGEAVLELLSRYTGGELLPAHESRDVVRAFKQVEAALRSQYVVSYKPADFEPNGKYRQIAVTVRNKKLNVECRRGYFAPRD
jgi:VWFA-related protein